MQKLLSQIALGVFVVAGTIVTSNPSGANQKELAIAQTVTTPIRVAQSAPLRTADIEQAIYRQINQHRISRRLPALSLYNPISEQARLHSQAMASGQVPFSHQGFEQRTQAIARAVRPRGAAENVATNQGFADPATVAVQGWLKSSGHRTNIEGQYNLTGIGVAQGGNGVYYFTQIFIRSR